MNARRSGIIHLLLVVEGDVITVDRAIAELRREERPSEHGAVEAGQDNLAFVVE